MDRHTTFFYKNRRWLDLLEPVYASLVADCVTILTTRYVQDAPCSLVERTIIRDVFAAAILGQWRYFFREDDPHWTPITTTIRPLRGN